MVEPLTIGMLTFQAVSCLLHSYHIKSSNCSIKDLCGCLTVGFALGKNESTSTPDEPAARAGLWPAQQEINTIR